MLMPISCVSIWENSPKADTYSTGVVGRIRKGVSIPGYDDIDGRWDKVPYDEPNAIHETEQTQAIALDVVRNARSFAVFGVARKSTDTVQTVSVIEAMITTDPHDDAASIESAMCGMMVRSFFDDFPNSEDASVLETIGIVVMRQHLLCNIERIIETVLREKGYIS